MTLKKKILVYKSIIKPFWTYIIQLWGSAAKSNIEVIQRFQAKVLRNHQFHRELSTTTVIEEIKIKNGDKKRKNIVIDF